MACMHALLRGNYYQTNCTLYPWLIYMPSKFNRSAPVLYPPLIIKLVSKYFIYIRYSNYTTAQGRTTNRLYGGRPVEVSISNCLR